MNNLSTRNTTTYTVDILLIFVRLSDQFEENNFGILVKIYRKTGKQANTRGV